MNENRITNIIQRGGIDNWETGENLAYLKRSYDFSTFEQAQYFV